MYILYNRIFINMKNSFQKINKKYILCFILSIVILVVCLANVLIFFGTPLYSNVGLVVEPTAGDYPEYTAGKDLIVGDYIEVFGGTRWRVVGKDENGVLIRKDTVIPNVAFDKERPIVKGGSSRNAYNSIIKIDGDSINSSRRRTNTGSNLYIQSDVRQFLNGEFMDRFDDNEKAQIAAVSIKNLFWIGDWKPSGIYKVPGTNSEYESFSFSTDADITGYTNIAGEKENRHINIFDPNSQYFVGAEINMSANEEQAGGWDDELAMDSAYLGSSYEDTLEKYNSFRTYNTQDKVFLLDVLQVRYIQSKTYLKNINGENYSIALDDNGDNYGYWTRTPTMGGWGFDGHDSAAYGSSALFLNDSGYISSVGVNLDGMFGGDSVGIAPVLYLKNETVLNSLGKVEPNINEPGYGELEEVERDTIVDNDKNGFRAFALSGYAKMAEELDVGNFANLQVGQTFKIVLLGKQNKLVGDYPKGLSVVKEGVLEFITGTPLEARDENSKNEFVVEREETENMSSGTSGNISVTVAKGIPQKISNNKLSVERGTSVDKLDLSSVKFSVDGKLKLDNNSTQFFETGVYKAIFNPDDLDNYSSIEIDLDIVVKFHVLQRDFDNLRFGEPFNLELFDGVFSIAQGDLPSGLSFKQVDDRQFIEGVPNQVEDFELVFERTDFDDKNDIVPSANIVGKVLQGKTEPILVQSISVTNNTKLREILLTNMLPSDRNGILEWEDSNLVVRGNVGEVKSFFAIYSPDDKNYESIKVSIELVIVRDSLKETVDNTFWIILAGGISGVLSIILFVWLLKKRKKSNNSGGDDNPSSPLERRRRYY